MKAHSNRIRNFQPLARVATIFAVVGLAMFLLAVAAYTDYLDKLKLTDPIAIVGIVGLAVLLVASLAAAISICSAKNKQISKSSIKKDFGQEFSNVSFTLLTAATVSFLLASAFFGKIIGNNPSEFFNNIQDFSNPFVVAATIAASVCLLSFLMYAVKSIIIPDQQSHVIILTDQQTVEEAKQDYGALLCSTVLPASGIDLATIVSCEILATQSQCQ